MQMDSNPSPMKEQSENFLPENEAVTKLSLDDACSKQISGKDVNNQPRYCSITEILSFKVIVALVSFALIGTCILLINVQPSNATSIATVFFNLRSKPFIRISQESLNWHYIQRLNETITKLNVSVGTNANFIKGLWPSIQYNTLQLRGMPDCCVTPNLEVPTLHFGQVTELNLVEMNICSNYVKTIVNNWKFPVVQSIRFHKVNIDESLFAALTNFIDKYNETLNRVEIDECFVCSSPACDAGLINFPDHDFQLVITSRRANLDSILN